MSDAALLARIDALEAQNKDLRSLVDGLKTELDATEKRLDEIEKSQGGGGGGGGGGAEGGKSKKQLKAEKKAAAKAAGKKAGGGGGGGGGEKQMTKAEKAAAKILAAAKKEGGKKGQDLIGMCDIGGMKYFTVTMEQCDGNWELLQLAMDGANKPVDPEGDDRKGGAGELGKCFLSVGSDGADCKMLFHMPKDKQGDLSLKEWATTMLSGSDVCGEIIEETDETIKAVAVKGAQGKELFPLKQRDAAINASFRMLKEKHLAAAESSGSEVDMGELAAGADIEW
jgi:hypothetical protein